MHIDALAPILPIGSVLRTWWPLAASWMLMALELPALSAVVARLPNPQVNLAAWGGLVFPLALIIEAPIIMLLAASTALSRDWQAFRTVRRYMMSAGAALTLLHIAVAFTPLYDLLVVGLIGPPAEIVEPARIGLRIMTPWTWAIAYRRFHQGMLIRFGHSRTVGFGTLVRLTMDLCVLFLGLWSGRIEGIVIASSAVAAGVVAEAIYAGWRSRPVLATQVRSAQPAGRPLDLKAFLSFYIPLAMTSLIFLLVQPIGSAALSRMPRPLESLAAWPVVSGLLFLLRSMGVAFNEVVIARLDEAGAAKTLRRFALILGMTTTVLLIAFAATPLAEFWFEDLSALPADLAAIASRALWFALPLPALSVFQSWFQGVIMQTRRTRAITEAVTIGLITISTVLGIGVFMGSFLGLYVGWAAFSLGTSVQVGWLWWRSRPALRELAAG